MTHPDPTSPARIYREPVPPIPTSEDPCPWFNEPDRGPDVVAWIMAAVMAALVFVTGFLIGWSL